MCHILIVEDETTIQKLWRQVLSPLASQITSSTTIYDALNIIDNDVPPDILLLDWKLNGDTADVVLDTWVSKVKGPVCIVTGALDTAERQKLYSRGVYNTFPKPLSVEVLSSVVRNYVKMVRTEKEIVALKGAIRKLRRQLFVSVTVILGILAGGKFVELVVPIIVGLL